ncbi:hypothetical protein A9P79_23415 [Cupriavidus taiwanensis]|uniref:WbqC family protein n=1 Tax=Cupriavidus taiwanensis TaxID=164546 RepID=UPI001F0105ED|nr:WbqC family protein [Cupriavidus taiwanensis]ULX54810.1 hypothetical protein A9P79_23415 [Cupriavidus taiwanensis]
MKTVAILQSNYIPWKGYFDLLAAVDEFVIYDEVQYTKNDWRNRNKIKTCNGTQWLSIPIRQERLRKKISETRVSDSRWAAKHWKALANNYAKAPYFRRYAEVIEEAYLRAGRLELLSEINLLFIRTVCSLLAIETSITSSSDYELVGDRTMRLADICQQASAHLYLSGPAAREYLDETVFAAKGIRVAWMDYSGYPAYDQLFPPFDHSVSILDLLFCTGPAAKEYMKAA